MKLFVVVKPGAKEDKVERVEKNSFVVRVRAQAKEGKANAAAIRLLARYFKTVISNFTILSGRTSHRKLIRLDL